MYINTIAIIFSVFTSLLIGILFTNKRFEDMNGRFEDLREDMNSGFKEMDRKFDELKVDMGRKLDKVDGDI